MMVSIHLLLSACSNSPENTHPASEDSTRTKVIQPNTEKSSEDTLGDFLVSETNRFISYLNANKYHDAQAMLHPEGIYFFTHGKIAKTNFTSSFLKKAIAPLDGAYGYGLPDETDSDSLVSGQFWIDRLTSNYQTETIDWHSAYQTLAYGFTGNYSSNHIIWDEDGFPTTPDSITIRVGYIEHQLEDVGSHDMLMVEFFQDSLGHWAIYALGNLEWTP